MAINGVKGPLGPSEIPTQQPLARPEPADLPAPLDSSERVQRVQDSGSLPPSDSARDAVLALIDHPLFGERPETMPADRPSLEMPAPPSMEKSVLLAQLHSDDPAVAAAIAALRADE